MISPQLQMEVAKARTEDLRRAAEAHGRTQDRNEPGRTGAGSLTLRFGSPADDGRLAWLAELESSKPPARPVLVAEVDGRLLAALALSDGTVLADPYQRTADLIYLLQTRARQLEGKSTTKRFRRLRSGRLRSSSRRRALAWR